MNIEPASNEPKRKIYYFVGLSCLLWGVIILPILMQIIWEFTFSIMSCFIGMLMAFTFIVIPMYFGDNWPSKDKEFHILFYPVITLSIGVLFYTLKYIW